MSIELVERQGFEPKPIKRLCDQIDAQEEANEELKHVKTQIVKKKDDKHNKDA